MTVSLRSLSNDAYKYIVTMSKHYTSQDATDRLFNPVHWFQFADDAAVVTTDELEKSTPLKLFY